MKRLLEDHIDAPIKKVVAGLSLLGFETRMSCCGFEYKEPAVKKSHLTGKPYVYLWRRQIFESPRLKEILCDLSLRSGWKFDQLSEEHVDFYGEKWKGGEDHPWGKDSAVHFYEQPLLTICSINKAIEVWKSEFRDYAYVRDGNHFYKNISSFWQYEPTEPWHVTPEIWAKIPS